MNPIQVTAYGLKSVISLLLGHTPIPDDQTTVNERLQILANIKPQQGDKVRLGILTVGNKGHRGTQGNNGVALTSIQDHTATDASLYGPCPMAIRPVDEDLPLAMRQKFCLREETTLNGEPVYKYWGVRVEIDPDDVVVNMKKITEEPGQPAIIETFVPGYNNLYPDPINLPTTGAVTTSDISIRVSAGLRILLTEDIVAEYVNALKMLNGGDERYAVMSEFALCTAADKQVQVNSSSGVINFLDVIGCQIYNFAMDHKAVYYNTQELTVDFEIGNQIPLLAAVSIPTIDTIGVTVP